MKRASIMLIALTIFTISCGPTYLSKCRENAGAEGWTKKEIEVACGPGGDRFYFAKANPDNTFTVLYSRLSVEEVREQLDRFISDLTELLDYKNEGVTRYVDHFGMREQFERDLKTARFVRSRVRVAELDIKFRESMDQVSRHESPEARYGYDARKIFLIGDPIKAFPFTSDQIEAAKNQGILKPIERLLLELDLRLAKKEPDPNYPNDPNRFIWKPASIAMELTNYKIINTEKPYDNAGNYIEGFRIVGGKKESRPALKIFFSNSDLSVVVIDSDTETETGGFGLPDYVDQIAGIVSVADVAKNDTILGRLFEEKPEDKRRPPKLEKMTVEIARIGEPVDVWIDCPKETGCLVPFPYRNASEDNYNVTVEINEPQHFEGPGHSSLLKEVEYISKRWTTGDVVEYFRPRPEFKHVFLAESSYGKNIRFILRNGSEETGIVASGENKFIEDEPYAISYKEGQKRWWIEKSEGSKVFDRKKEVVEDRGDRGYD